MNEFMSMIPDTHLKEKLIFEHPLSKNKELGIGIRELI
jgi:hypothetical protein